MLDRQFIYIVGAPRSGTTWLQMMLGAHPSVCTTVELTLFSQYIAAWLKIREREAAIPARGGPTTGLRHLWTDEEFDALLREFLERVYARVLESRPDATHVVEKQPSYSAHTAVIDRLVFGARFLHIIRDGRDVVASMLAAHRDMGMAIETVEKAATTWKRHVRDARAAARFDGRYFELRYEDLRERPEAVLDEALAFCGLTIDPKTALRVVESHAFDRLSSRAELPGGTPAPQGFFRRGAAGGWRTELTSEQIAEVHRVAGDLLLELGYEN